MRLKARLYQVAFLAISFLSVAVLSAQSDAEIFGGIDFPAGASSFADSLIRYDPLFGGGPGPTEPAAMEPLDALGIPDFPAGGTVGDPGAVSLGRGGLIELAFTDNLLTNSGGAGLDLHIFEVGAQVEDTFVAIRPNAMTLALLPPGGDSNGDGFFEIGKVFGAISSVDIDSFFPGFLAGELSFNGVQLIDDPAEGGVSGSTVGADIDAVGAIASVFVPETNTLLLALIGTATILANCRCSALRRSP